MGLLSILSKKKQESKQDEGQFSSRAVDDSNALRARARRNRSGGARAGDEDEAGVSEKKRARRRLVGAAALVLAVVIGLPMLFDSEPKPVAPDIPIQMPSKDKPAASANASAAASAPVVAASAPAVATGAGLDKNEEVVDLPAAATSVTTTGAAHADLKAAAPVAAVAAVAAGAALPHHAGDDKAAARSEAKAPAKADLKAKAPAEAKAELKPDLKAEVKAEPKASVKAEAKAPAKAELKAKAPADAAKPADKAAADAARATALLEGTDIDAKPTAKASEPGATDKSGKFVIQVASLATAESVAQLRAKLGAAGLKSSTQAVATQSGQRTRVRLGPFGSRAEADKALARLKSLHLSGTLVAL